MRLLILDACVLIDLFEAEPNVFRLVNRHLGRVHVARQVFNEVDQLKSSEARRLGLTMVEPTIDVAIDAAARQGRLSFPDWICVLMARERGWTCVTNDSQVRKACARERVTVWWGLQLLLRLVESGGMSKNAALKVARDIAAGNRFLAPAVLADFETKLGALKRSR